MLRESHYRSDDLPLSAEEKAHLNSHIDHCIELLRQTSLCHADTSSLTTFKWHPQKPRPMFNASESVHTCVDWGALMESVESRVVDEEEILRLGNPLMGGGGGS